MTQQYEHTFLYFLLIYIVKLTYNDKYLFLYFVVENKNSCLLHNFSDISVPIFDKCTFRTIQPPHEVVSINGSILYYKMNQKSTYETSVLT